MNSIQKVNTPIIIITIFLFFGLSCSRDYAPEKILVPYGYVGWVLIVYEQRGFEKIEESGYRIYKIPKSGLLFTGHKANWGVIRSNDNDILCYYVDSTYKIVKQLPVYIQPSDYFKSNYINSTVAFPLPPSGKGKYTVYPIYIDTLKNIDKIDKTPIEEQTIDSILINSQPVGIKRF